MNNSYKYLIISLLVLILSVASIILFDVKNESSNVNILSTQKDDAEYTAEMIRASGKCAQCHLNETPAVLNNFSHSKHSKVGVNCYDCHRVVKGQKSVEHSGFLISEKVTSLSCAQCHSTQYDQFLKSRHAAPAWAAVMGRDAFTKEQIEYSEKFHPGATDRARNALALAEGQATIDKGCAVCHKIGRPNHDGSVGECTGCHSAHRTSVALARAPETCGSCHLGPDHSQLEIYKESKHGVMFATFKDTMNLNAPPRQLTTKDMPIPTCATCHMSGLEGQKFTHDVTERLSYWLFAPISKKRPHYEKAQAEMKATCMKCHASSQIDQFYKESEAVVDDTNEKIAKIKIIFDELKKDNLLTPEPFDEPIEFLYFDIWHYFGRTAKHGAFMGGGDYVQWHGSYEIIHKTKEFKEMADEIRKNAKEKK